MSQEETNKNKLTTLKKLILFFKGGGKIDLTGILKRLKGVDIGVEITTRSLENTIDNLTYYYTDRKYNKFDDVPRANASDYLVTANTGSVSYAHEGGNVVSGDIEVSMPIKDYNSSNGAFTLALKFLEDNNLTVDDYFVHNNALYKVSNIDMNNQYITFAYCFNRNTTPIYYRVGSEIILSSYGIGL